MDRRGQFDNCITFALNSSTWQMIIAAPTVIYAMKTWGNVVDKRADKDGGEAHL